MSLLLRLENSCQGACFGIFVLDILPSMPASKNASNFASRFGFLRLVTNPHELSGLASPKPADGIQKRENPLRQAYTFFPIR